MRVDNRAEDHGRSGPRVNAMQPSRGMDSDGQQGSPHRRQDTRSKRSPWTPSSTIQAFHSFDFPDFSITY